MPSDSAETQEHAEARWMPLFTALVALKRAGGSISFDLEEAVMLRGHTIGWSCERGTVTVRAVKVESEGGASGAGG